jgi:hypothetical protein
LYLDACFYNATKLDFMTAPYSIELNIKKFKYMAKLSIQLSSALYSAQDYKKSALVINLGYNYSCKAITDTLTSCRKVYNTHFNKPKPWNYSKAEINKILLVQRALPILEALGQFISHKIIKKTKMRSALGIKAHPEWIYNFSLNNFIKIGQVKSLEFKNTLGVQSEFTKDCILYKVALLSTSLFYLGLTHQANQDIKKAIRFLSLSNTLNSAFFPKNSQFFKHIQENLKITSDKNIEKFEDKPKDKIRRHLSANFCNKKSENNSIPRKKKSAYEKSNKTFIKLTSNKKIKRYKSEISDYAKEIQKSISFRKINSEYE